MRSADLEKESELLKRAKTHLETERPLRELEMTPEDKKRFRGFMFLSEKPILYVLNISQGTELGKDLEAAITKYGLAQIIGDGGGAGGPARARSATQGGNTPAPAICGKAGTEPTATTTP